jgi:hypothetical protein
MICLWGNLVKVITETLNAHKIRYLRTCIFFLQDIAPLLFDNTTEKC